MLPHGVLEPHPVRVLVTRSARQGSTLADELRALGLEPVIVPAIEITEPTSFDVLDEAIAQLSTFDWLIFTSANAVEVFSRRRARLGTGEPFAEGGRPRVAVIGSATAQAARTAGLVPDLQPAAAVAESLTAALLPFATQPDGRPARLLLVRAEQAREHLPETLRAAGAEVLVAAAYRTQVPADSQTLIRDVFAEQGVDPIRAIAFTSSSTVRNLLTLCDAANVALPWEALRISIGPITSQTLREVGLPPHAEAAEASVASLARAVAAALERSS